MLGIVLAWGYGSKQTNEIPSAYILAVALGRQESSKIYSVHAKEEEKARKGVRSIGDCNFKLDNEEKPNLEGKILTKT